MPVKRSKQPNQSQPVQDGDKSEQFRRFVETARQLGTDESVENFERRLQQIAKVKPKKRRSKRESG